VCSNVRPMSSIAAAYAIGNVASSVAIVLVNKQVFKGGFHFPMTLSFFHFLFTILWFKLLGIAGAYTPAPAGSIPQWEKFKVAAALFSSIGFMNLSLNANSIGFYQVTKLTIIPVTLIINAIMYGVHTTAKIMVSLSILLAGVGVATVTEVHLRPIGFMYGCCAILTTAICQIWQGSKQKEFEVSATQLQAALAPWMTAQALVTAAATEFFCYDGGNLAAGPTCDTALTFFKGAFDGSAEQRQALWIGLCTCFLALMVNFCSFGLIGRTSAITFQVVGHAKTCLVLVGGYVFFPAHGKKHQQQLYNNMMGVSVAMVGVIIYGHLKHAAGQSQRDCFDIVCPGCCALEANAASESEKAEQAEAKEPLAPSADRAVDGR